MDWDRYYKEQIIKSNNNTLNNVTYLTGNYTFNNVTYFTENQTVGFINKDWLQNKLKRSVKYIGDKLFMLLKITIVTSVNYTNNQELYII